MATFVFFKKNLRSQRSCIQTRMKLEAKGCQVDLEGKDNPEEQGRARKLVPVWETTDPHGA